MAVSATKHKHWNEMVGLTLLAAGLLISLSLISYSATDPSFSVSGAGQPTKNFIGVIGAYLSDALLRLFGVTAYLFPLFMFGYGVFFEIGAKAEHPLLKKIGGLVLFFTSASFLSLQGDTARLFGEVVPSGGMLGSLISHLLVSGFSAAGSYIITVTALIISLMLLTPFSPLKMLACLRAVYGRLSDQTDLLIEHLPWTQGEGPGGEAAAAGAAQGEAGDRRISENSGAGPAEDRKTGKACKSCSTEPARHGKRRQGVLRASVA